MKRQWMWLGVAMLGALALADIADARVGGGQGFGTGGGGYSGGSGSSGGSDDAIGLILYLIVRLCIEYPQIGLPLLFLFLVFLGLRWWWMNRDQARQVHRHRERMHNATTTAPRSPRQRQAAEDQLRELDAGFSAPVLFEFVQLVHRRALEATGTGAWAPLAPFVAPPVREALSGELSGVVAVSGVVHAGIRLESVQQRGGKLNIELMLLGSRREHGAGGGVQTWYFEERWTFSREAKARSLPPEDTLRLGCPSCGAAVETDTSGACVYCGSPITKGQLQWQAVAMRPLVRRHVQPPQVGLLQGGDEPGALVPSVVDPQLGTAYRAFCGRHSDFDQQAFLARVEGVFAELQASWSENGWERARPYVTDPLYEQLRFQVEQYREAGLRNRVEDVVVERVDLVRIRQDAWYESITVRLWASARDWVEDGQGKVVGGNQRQKRRFSEYWTFLRASGTGAGSKAVGSCPSCGAALDRINAAGICGYCDSRVVSGRFDWVLSRIDQPQVYQG